VRKVTLEHCPHLDFGGRVEAGVIHCPFHGWRIGPDGSCVGIPYAGKVPPKARIAAWTVREREGLIFTHYLAEGTKSPWEVTDKTPLWRELYRHVVHTAQ